MNHWFVRVHRTEKDPFDYPYFGKVQYFRTELLFHRFAIIEHPDYPGPYRARFIAAHAKDSIISYIALRYGDIGFDYYPLNDVKSITVSLGP
jgi:hypothetical protein